MPGSPYVGIRAYVSRNVSYPFTRMPQPPPRHVGNVGLQAGAATSAVPAGFDRGVAHLHATADAAVVALRTGLVGLRTHRLGLGRPLLLSERAARADEHHHHRENKGLHFIPSTGEGRLETRVATPFLTDINKLLSHDVNRSFHILLEGSHRSRSDSFLAQS